MPTKKSKDDTWKESELLDAIQGADKPKKKSSSSRPREKESSGHRPKGESSKEKDRERGERKDRDVGKRREDADSRHRKDAEHRDRERKRERDRDKDRDREGKRDKESHQDREERRDKDPSRDKERERRKHREVESRDTKDSSERRRTERDRTEKDRAEEGEDRKRRKDKRGDKQGERSEGKLREARTDEGRERDKDRTSDRKHERSGERRKEKDGSRDKLTEKVRDIDNGEGRRDSAERERRKTKDSKSRSKDKSDKHRSRRKEDHDFDDRVEQRDSEKESDKEWTHRSEKSKSHKSKSKHSDDVVGAQTSKESSHRDENSKRSRETSRYKPEKEIPKQESYEEDIEEETTKRPSTTIRKESILNTEEVNEEVIAAAGGDDYDDDFEDYDDDFEDDEGDDASGDKEEEGLNLTNEELEGVDEIRKAMREENALAESHNSSASSSRPSTRDGMRDNQRGSSTTPAAKNQARGKINFIAAKQKQISNKVSSRTRRRGKELKKLIELDVVAMNLFELQPLNIYEVYMKSFGRTGTEQVAVQTNDDNLEQETQTDDIETETRWCQFSNEVQAFGGGDEKSQQSATEKKSLMTQDTRRLNKFLGRAAQLCLTLLDEVNVKLERTSNRYKESRSAFSDSCAKIDVKHRVTNGRKFVDAQLSPTQSNLLLVAYGIDKESKDSISPEGLLCVWNINESDEPRKYLSCGSTPRCCCFSPTKPSFAFAGMDDGSVSVWDLREPPSLHSRKKLNGLEFILRLETFSTASVYGEENHISSVVSLVSIAPPEDSDSSNRDSRDTIDNSGRALQLASLEENGTVNIWVVIEVFSPDPGGSEQDLGLLPGGKVKLVKSGSISPQIPKRSLGLPRSGNYTATRLHVERKNAQYFYIGTDQGEVLHCSRFGEKVIPKSFFTCDPDSPVMVSSIDHSPFMMPYVLVGCSDGSILLFDSNKEFPITTWQMFSRGAGIVAARWSHNKPSVFYVLDGHSFFYVWDLFKSNNGPIVKESMAKGGVRPSNFYLSDDPSGNQEVVFFNNDNSLEVHKLKKMLVDSSKDDIESLCTQMEQLS